MKWTPKNTYAVIIFFSILIMTFCVHYVYTLLGGYQEVVVYHLGADHRLVVGRSFSGRQTSKTIEEYYTESRAMVLDSTLKGTLTVISFEDPKLTEGEVSLFIGVILTEESAEVPMDYELKKFNCHQKLVAFLSMQSMVMPNATEVELKLKQKADSLNIELSNFIFEMHYPDNSKIIEAWSKK